MAVALIPHSVQYKNELFLTVSWNSPGRWLAINTSQKAPMQLAVQINSASIKFRIKYACDDIITAMISTLITV